MGMDFTSLKSERSRNPGGISVRSDLRRSKTQSSVLGCDVVLTGYFQQMLHSINVDYKHSAVRSKSVKYCMEKNRVFGNVS